MDKGVTTPEKDPTPARAKQQGDGEEITSSMIFYDEEGTHFYSGPGAQKPNPPMIPVEGEIKLPG